MNQAPTLPSSFRCGYFDCSIFGELPRSPERKRERFEIEYYLENGKHTYSDGQAYKIKKNHVLIGRPGEICNSELPFRTYFLKLDVDGLIAETLTSLPTYFPTLHTYEIEKHFDALISLYMQENADPFLLYSHLLALLSLFTQDARLSGESDGASSLLVEKAKNYIHEHSAERINLTSIAASVNLSPSYFHSLFLAHCGITPHEYLTERRLLNARELLCVTSLSIEEIAQKCGFGSQQYLSNVFQHHLHTSPGKCRKDYRESYLR